MPDLIPTEGRKSRQKRRSIEEQTEREREKKLLKIENFISTGRVKLTVSKKNFSKDNLAQVASVSASAYNYN